MKTPRIAVLTGFILLCITMSSRAQLQVTETSDALTLVQRLVGDGVTISNVSVTQSPSIIPTGLFKNLGGTNIGIDSGIVLTCGRAKSDFRNNRWGVDGDGTATASARLADNNLNLPGDPTLANELGIPLSALNDAVVLEFDFVPLGDSIRFNYVMSSEEYTPGTVCVFNDAFGFFISGPGITGTKNIALIPNTTTPVTITNINNIPSAGCVNNPGYYKDNTSNTFFLHEGHTAIFTALEQVQPCETYHLKLVVADRGDHLWDTGVFLQAKSLTSNAIGMTNLTQTDPNGNSYLVEGCATGSFEIRRPRKDPTPLVVSLSYGGTAVNGTDVQPLPLSVVIPANDSFVVVNVVPIVDGLPEGIEVLKVYALAGCAAGTPTDSTIIQIRDYDILSLSPDTAYICRNSSLQLLASPGYSVYQWNPDPTLSSTAVPDPVATPVSPETTYICTAIEGTCNARDSVFLKWKEVSLLASRDVNCRGGNDGEIHVSAGSAWALPLEYSLDGVNWQATGDFSGLPAGIYRVKVRDGSCTDSITVNVAQAYPDLVIDNALTLPASCTGGADGQITVNSLGGNNSYQYSLDGSSFQPGNIFNVMAGDYTVTLKDGNGCLATANVTVPLNNTVTLDAGDNASICKGKSLLLPATSNGATISWTPATGLDNPAILNPTASPDISTRYYVEASTGVCLRRDSIDIAIRPSPVADAGPDASYCFGKEFQLTGSGGLTYQWRPATSFISPATDQNPLLKANRNISYYLTVTNAEGCSSLAEDEVQITVTPTVKLFAGKDTIAAIGQPVQLHVEERGTSNVVAWRWEPGQFLDKTDTDNPIATLPYDFRYIVTGTTADGCEGKDDVFIKVYQGPEIYVPSAFTPNNDGLNDILHPVPVGIEDFHYFRVFNRWGQVIFATRIPSAGWDGRISGVDQPTGTYVWMAEGIDYKGNLVSRRGVVTLIR